MTGQSRVAQPYLIGVVSDTHGLLSDAAYEALRGADAIVHAGDIGARLVLDILKTIAPVVLVNGNNRYAVEAGCPQVADVVLGGVRVIVAHCGEDVPTDFTHTGVPVRVIVTGHTHVGHIEERDGIVTVNPGSPSLPRKGSGRSVALVEVRSDGAVSVRLVPIA